MTENQINELFRLMNKAITKIDGLGNKIYSFNAKFDDAEEKKKNFYLRWQNFQNSELNSANRPNREKYRNARPQVQRAAPFLHLK